MPTDLEAPRPAAPWRNWCGLAESTPARVVMPGSTDEVAAAVRTAAEDGLRVKMPGSGHSFTAVALTDGVLLDPSRLRGVVAVDRAAWTVRVRAGTRLHELNSALDAEGLALHNLGDIDRQTVAGALSTGTHGTGGTTGSLAGQVEALTLVTGTGEVVHCSREERADLFHAARVGLGAVGVLTEVTLRVEPAFLLRAHERPMLWDEVLDCYDDLVAGHHHVDFFWFPHTERCLVKANDRTVDAAEPLGAVRAWFEDDFLSNTVFGAIDALCTRAPALTPRVNGVTSRLLSERTFTDVSHRVFVSPRRVVFKEMEYAVPREDGVALLREVRALIERRGWLVPWPVEVRCTPADDAWLSTTQGRPSMYLAFHVGRDAEHRAFFGQVEHLLREAGGRPHWGKLHTRTADDLAGAYAHWDDFARVRDEVDPGRAFSNDYLDRVLG